MGRVAWFEYPVDNVEKMRVPGAGWHAGYQGTEGNIIGILQPEMGA